MIDITKAIDVDRCSLSELRQLSQDEIDKRPALADVWNRASMLAGARQRQRHIDSLLQEFCAPMRGQMSAVYDLAFVPSWYSDPVLQPLYNLRWWINAYPAGVYFIYQTDGHLAYIGRTCGGQLGARIWHADRSAYREDRLIRSPMGPFRLGLRVLGDLTPETA